MDGPRLTPPLSGGSPSPSPAAEAKRDEAAAAHKAAQGLEAFLVRRMLSEMRGSLGGSAGGLLDGGFAGSTFREMLDEALADHVSAAGGIGLAPIFERELAGKRAAPPTAAALDKALKPAAAAIQRAHPASRAERVYRAAGSSTSPVVDPQPPPDDPGVELPALHPAGGRR